MSVRLDLEPQEIDLIFLALQHAQTPAPFVVIQALLDKMLKQGKPQLDALAGEAQEPQEAEKVGGTD